MSVRLRLGELSLEANSQLWSVDERGEEPVLQLTGHTHVEHIRDSQVALIEYAGNDYSVEAEMRFLANYLPDPSAGWFGFALRAQDFMNYEVVWFIPGAEAGLHCRLRACSSRHCPLVDRSVRKHKRKEQFRFQGRLVQRAGGT